MHIYTTTNLANGKIYGGQIVQKNSMNLYNGMRKYVIENFVWQIIDTATCLDDLNAKEKHWLDFYQAESDVYDAREAGGNKLHFGESRFRMQESQKQAHGCEQTKGREAGRNSKNGGAMKGKVHPRKGTEMWNMPEPAKEKLRKVQLERSVAKGKTWKTINGNRVYMEKMQ